MVQNVVVGPLHYWNKFYYNTPVFLDPGLRFFRLRRKKEIVSNWDNGIDNEKG